MIMTYKAWLLAVFSITVLWGLGNLAVGYSSKILEANGIVYTCSLFFSASWVLLLYAGHGPLSKETLRSLDTWGYGLVLIVGFLLSFAIFSHVTAAEGALLQRSSIVASLVSSWFFLSRSIGRYQIIGSVLVFAGVIWVSSGVNIEHRATIYGLVFLFAFLQAARVFIAEFHKPHKVASQKSNDPKSRCRVVGYVMFVVAMLFMIPSLLGAVVHHQTGQLIMSNMPTLQDFLHPEAVLFGLFVGAVIIAPIRLIEFASSQEIKSENYLALAAISPFSTLFWEWFTHPLTGLSLKDFTMNDVMSGLLITFGGILAAYGGVKKKDAKEAWKEYLKVSSQDIDIINDSREIVANTLEHFEGDLQKSAEALGVPEHALHAVLTDTDKVLAFKASLLQEISRKYRRNVALSDALTGLANRAGFMTALKGATYEADVFSVIFIDLDKFKPINDTYGHDAGDFVLQSIAERLAALFPKRALATRLGGDEFCVLLLDHDKIQAEKVMPRIQQTIEQPFTFAGHRFSVCASMGVASFPEDATSADALLTHADHAMYDHKKR